MPCATPLVATSSPAECAAPSMHLTGLRVQVGTDRLRGALQVGDAVAAISSQHSRRAGAAMGMLRAAVAGRPGERAMGLLHRWRKATEAARLVAREQGMAAHMAALAAQLHQARGSTLRRLWAGHNNMLRHCVLAWVRGRLSALAAQCRHEQEARGRLETAENEQRRKNDEEKRKRLQEEAEHAKAEEVQGHAGQVGHVGHVGQGIWGMWGRAYGTRHLEDAKQIPHQASCITDTPGTMHHRYHTRHHASM